MNLPAVICAILLVAGLFRPVSFLMTLSMALVAFGSLAILPPEFTGGTSLLGATVATLFLVIKVVSMPDGIAVIAKASIDHRRLGFLTLFTVIAIVGAVFLPVIFQGTVDVFPLRATRALSAPEPVAPATANFTQSAYLIVSFLVAGSYCWLVRRDRFVDDFGWAVVVGAITVVLTGVLEIIANRLGMTDVLSAFRTASYAYLAGAEIQGVKRTVGLMPEASSFGGLAAFYFSLLLFTRNMYAPSIRTRFVLPLIAACATFAVLSTSSTAYAELGIIVGLFVLDGTRGLFLGTPANRSRNLREVTFVVVVTLLLLFAAMLFEESRDTLFAIFDQVVLQKTQSASYVERSSWSRVAFEAWWTTGGLGVGVGSVRTSNFFVNILASTGFLGFGLFLAFLIKVFVSPPPMKDQRMAELVRGSKLTLIPSLVGASLAGTTPDYGGTIAALFGIIAGATALNYSRPRVARLTPSSSQDRTNMLR